MFDSLKALLPIAKIQAEPYLPVILSLLSNPSQEELFNILFVTGLFCDSIIGFEDESDANDLVTVSLQLLDSAVGSFNFTEGFHI